MGFSKIVIMEPSPFISIFNKLTYSLIPVGLLNVFILTKNKRIGNV